MPSWCHAVRLATAFVVICAHGCGTPRPSAKQAETSAPVASGEPVVVAEPATPSNVQRQEAATHFKAGLELFKDGDYRASLVELQRAYELAPNFNVHYNIGQAYLQLQDYPAALAALERYLDEGKDQIPAARTAEVTKDIEKLQARVAQLTIELDGGRGASVTAEVTIDGFAVGKAPGEFIVSAGRHELAIGKIVRVVEIRGGENQTLRVPVANY